jgi:hypothetical protein
MFPFSVLSLCDESSCFSLLARDRGLELYTETEYRGRERGRERRAQTSLENSATDIANQCWLRLTLLIAGSHHVGHVCPCGDPTFGILVNTKPIRPHGPRQVVFHLSGSGWCFWDVANLTKGMNKR